jgi:hypothetical protein
MNRLFLPIISFLIFLMSAESYETDKPGSAVMSDDDLIEDVIKAAMKPVKRQLRKVLGALDDMKSEVRLLSQQKLTLQSALDDMRSEVKLISQQKLTLQNNTRDLKKVIGALDVMRSEVRLISQQKLTWQNSTREGKYPSDFAVDGVYRAEEDDLGMNPISHTEDARKGPNQMVIIDLGALFKIHTVKLWKRHISCCDHRNVGLQIYADGTKIGQTTSAPHLNNLPVKGTVYGSKIYVKQPRSISINFLEIQVFGAGPYTEDEI